MGKLDRAGDTLPFQRLKTKLDELRADPRYTFMFSGMLVSDSMARFLAKLFRLPSQGRPISIVDVSGVPSEVTSVVVSVLARMVFDYAIWSRTEAQRPLLLVCEEAHRYVPKDENSGGQAVRKILERIAKEGRKYGVSLGLITQRPSDLAEGVLSQCGTIISMRLNNDRDQACVRAAMPEGARGFLDAIPALRNRECIVCGEGVAIPIRVRFDDLEPEKRPASSDPSFARLWRETGDEEGIISTARSSAGAATAADFDRISVVVLRSARRGAGLIVTKVTESGAFGVTIPASLRGGSDRFSHRSIAGEYRRDSCRRKPSSRSQLSWTGHVVS